MNNVKLIKLAYILLIIYVKAEDVKYQTLKVYKPHDVKVAYEVFNPPINIENGVVLGDITHPALRILEAKWVKYLNPDIGLDEFLTYFHVENEKQKDTLSDSYSKIDDDFINTNFAKYNGKVNVNGIVFFEKNGVEYCYIDLVLAQQASNVTIVKYGIKSDGKWKVYSEQPSVVDFGPIMLGRPLFVKKALESFGILDSENNKFQIIKDVEE